MFSTPRRRPSFTRRWLLAATWPVGVVLTAWDYMWRSTPLHRREVVEAPRDEDQPPSFPDGIDDTDVLPAEEGSGPFFHRRYRTAIRDTTCSAAELMRSVQVNLNRPAPTRFARFQRVQGEGDGLHVGDEFVVRMPGPWDGPVRVVARDDHRFRLATLRGHLEAGQIEFRVCDGEDGDGGGLISFEIESWARSADRVSDLLYHKIRIAKEVQLHMWISFLEGVVALSGGRMTGGIEIDTRQVAPQPQPTTA